MKVIIIGGGKVGGHLARILTARKDSVVVIEMSETRAQNVAQQTRALVIEGDGTDVRILSEADCSHADYLIAVTGSDEDNLVACQLARTAFGCDRVLARVNDPRNEPTFEALGVPQVSVTGLFVQILGQHLEVQDLNRVAALGRGEAGLIEIEVPAARSPAAVAALARLRAARWEEALAAPLGRTEMELKALLETHMTRLIGQPTRTVKFLREVRRLSEVTGERA